MHRDISSGNILIYEKKPGSGVYKGLLVDWDLSKLVSVEHSRVRHRTVREPYASLPNYLG
jgi:hypothetical protein